MIFCIAIFRIAIFRIAIFRIAAVDVRLDQPRQMRAVSDGVYSSRRPKLYATFFHPRSHREAAA
jgi:hypothetical protein